MDILPYWYTINRSGGGYMAISHHTGIHYKYRGWLYRDIPPYQYQYQYSYGGAYIGIYHHISIHNTNRGWLYRDIPLYWYTQYSYGGGYIGIYQHTGIHYTYRMVATYGYTTILVYPVQEGWWLLQTRGSTR